jgi:hypothetical protein
MPRRGSPTVGERERRRDLGDGHVREWPRTPAAAAAAADAAAGDETIEGVRTRRTESDLLALCSSVKPY